MYELLTLTNTILRKNKGYYSATGYSYENRTLIGVDYRCM